MESNKFLLQRGDKRKHSTLDKAYTKHINSILATIDEDDEFKWETYDLIMKEFIKSGKIEYMSELKYRITDGENPSEIILDLINRDSDEVNTLVWDLKKRIEGFIEEDYFKNFL